MSPGSPLGAALVDLRDLVESIPHIVWICGPGGANEYQNQRACEYAGSPADEVDPGNWLDLVHSDDVERAKREWAEAVGAETSYEMDCRLRRRDGVYRWHTLRGQLKRDDGAIVRWINTATDIDDRKRFEDELCRSQRAAAETLSLLETLQSAAPVGLGFVDRDCRIVRMNDMLAEFNGGSIAEQIGRTVAEVVPEVWAQIEPLYRRVLDHGESVLNIDVGATKVADRSQVRHTLASYYPVRLDDEIIGVGVVVVDITQRFEAAAVRNELMHSAVDAIAATIDARDPYTAGHQRHVAELAAAIAAELGLDPDAIEGVRLAAGLHDVGKIGVPVEILTRPSELRPAEWELLKTHPGMGYDILAGIDFPWPIAVMVLQHHERLDGSGYPNGLRGDQIILGARIIAVADTLEAMEANRPFRLSPGVDAALDELRDGRGTRYDTTVVDACVRLGEQGRLPLDQPHGGRT